MKSETGELERVLARVVDDIRNDDVDAAVINGAASRVWARIAAQPAVEAQLQDSEAESTGSIRGCLDFRSLIPAYLRGELSSARSLLLSDHTNECVPCRRALKEMRGGRTAQPPSSSVSRSAQPIAGSRSMPWRWGIAAAVVLCVGLASLFLMDRIDLSGTSLAATIESESGEVYRVSDSETRPLGAGDRIQKGEHVRTSRDSGAMLRLVDGSVVEMRERSEFSVSENRKGVTIQLDRGNLMVEAAKRRSGNLFVATPDSLASVTGTIFAVDSGTKGSRVSVVDGEVHVRNSGEERILRAGDQATSNPNLDRVPVSQAVSWSRNAPRYVQLVTELAKLRKDLDQNVPRPGVRYTSRFLDLVPDSTVIYAALPNLGATLSESHRIMKERISQNPALRQWWESHNHDAGTHIDAMIDRIREFSSYLGDEIVVSAGFDAKGEPGSVLVLGELKDSAGFRPYLEKQIAGLASEGKSGPSINIVDDPFKATAAQSNGHGNGEIFVWIRNDLFAASPDIAKLRELATTLTNAGSNHFVGTPFHERLAEIYHDGAGLIVAADLERVVGKIEQDESAKPGSAQHLEAFRELGLRSVKDLVVEQKDLGGKTQSRLALSFNGPRRGIASWLAAPGPMGALQFVSPEANVAAAFVVKEPALLVDDLLGFLDTVQPNVRSQLRDLEAKENLQLRRDFAAPLGGEFAFAIDGPVLPTPSWKMILEVNDQAHLQQTLERTVEKLNAWAAKQGKAGLRLDAESEGGRTFFTLRSLDFGFETHYTYADGYLIVTPTRALLDRALKTREAGNTLLRSPRFTSALPEDGNTNFSAVLYHDLAPVLGSLPQYLPEKQRDGLAALAANSAPTVAYAYAQDDRVTVSANTEGGPFGLGPAALLGMPNSLEIQNILMSAIRGGGATKP